MPISKAETDVRARLEKNGRNPANKNAGIRVGSDLHLCEMLLADIDAQRAILLACAQHLEESSMPNANALLTHVLGALP